MEIKTEAGYDMPGGEEICLKTEHFQVFAGSAHRKEAGHFSELLERNYFKIHEDFHFPLRKRSVAGQDSACGEEASEGRLRCYLCSGVPEYLRRTGKRAEDYEPWMVGYADSSRGIICLLLPQEREETGEKDCDGPEESGEMSEIEKIAIHELVHIVFDRHCGVMDGEAWLNEGIAILYAGQTDLRYVSEADCPEIGTLGGQCVDGETPDEFADNGGYDYAGIYVWQFIRKYGFEKFLAAYRNEICACEILPEGFEREAVAAYLSAEGSRSLEEASEG